MNSLQIYSVMTVATSLALMALVSYLRASDAAWDAKHPGTSGEDALLALAFGVVWPCTLLYIALLLLASIVNPKNKDAS